MPRFAFVVEGPPVSVNSKNTLKLSRWKAKVRKATQDAWRASRLPVQSDSFEVTVTNYFRIQKERPSPPDVDNILKPILDGIKTIVFVDDNSVSEVVSNRFDLANGIDGANPDLAAAIAQFEEFIYVQINWKEL